MRLPWGSLTRRMPRTVAQPTDVMLMRAQDEEGRDDGWFVAPAVHLGPWNEPTVRLSRVVRTRKQAMGLAWALAGLRGGRLLDYQGRTLAEQPLRWEVELRVTSEQMEHYRGFQKRTPAREHLTRALACWAGMSRQNAQWVAAQIIAGRGKAVIALTQSEIRRAMGPPEPMRPKAAEIFSLLRFRRVDVHPPHLLQATTAAQAKERAA